MLRAKNVGVYAGPFLSESDFMLLRGIVSYARKEGAWRFTHDRGNTPVLRDEGLACWNGDGLITVIPQHPRVLKLAEQGTPVVSVGFDMSDLAYQVLVDRRVCGALGAKHLLEQGFDRFALLFEASTPSCSLDTGFTETLQEAERTALVARIPASCRTPAQATAWCTQWLSSLTPPVGIMSASELLGCRLITLCQEKLSLHVPSDIAVVGVAAGDINGDSQSIGLSRVAVDLEKVGYEAARMLGQVMRGERPKSGTIRIPPRTVVQRESTDRQHLQDHEVNRALQYIRLNANRPIQVGDVVDCVRVSRSTLKTRFRRERNRTIQEEIRGAHVERAKLLLQNTDRSLSRIATDCGFAQLSRLSEVFKRETGMTPTSYRHLRQGKSAEPHPAGGGGSGEGGP